jgi:hypothetical protein
VNEPDPYIIVVPKRGELASVWTRETARHQWLCELSLVRVLQVFEDSVLVQTSQTGQQHRNPGGTVMEQGPTSMCLGKLRQLRSPRYWPMR